MHKRYISFPVRIERRYTEIENIGRSAAELKAVLLRLEVAAMMVDLATLLRRPTPIDVEALREADLQMVFNENGQIVFKERSG